MIDLVSVGNISIDVYFQGESLTFKDDRFQLAVGGKYFADKVVESVGGGGANVAIGAAKAGLKSAVFGKIGNNPFKKIILDKLEESHVSTDLCQYAHDYLNISSILLTPKGERSIIHYTTPHQHIIGHKDELKKILLAKTVYFGNLPDVSMSEKIQIIHLLKKNQIITVANLGVKDCRRTKDQLHPFLKLVDILIINGHEFAELVKAPYKDLHFKDNVIDWYIPMLSEKIVIITEGEKGSFAYHFSHIYHQKAYKPEKIIDTTGAGDGFTAGFISEFHKSSNIEKSMDSGAKYAAKILAKIGAN